jgi:hypothetical protein
MNYGFGGLFDGLDLGNFNTPKKKPIDRGIPDGMKPGPTTQGPSSPDASFMDQAQQLAGNESGIGRYGEQYTPAPSAPSAPSVFDGWGTSSKNGGGGSGKFSGETQKADPSLPSQLPPGLLGQGGYGGIFSGMDLSGYQPTQAPAPKPAPKPAPSPAQTPQSPPELLQSLGQGGLGGMFGGLNLGNYQPQSAPAPAQVQAPAPAPAQVPASAPTPQFPPELFQYGSPFMGLNNFRGMF